MKLVAWSCYLWWSKPAKSSPMAAQILASERAPHSPVPSQMTRNQVSTRALLQHRRALRAEGWAIEQRVWKWQPDGGFIGLGTSPLRRMRSRLSLGSGTGTAESTALV